MDRPLFDALRDLSAVMSELSLRPPVVLVDQDTWFAVKAVLETECKDFTTSFTAEASRHRFEIRVADIKIVHRA